MSLLWHKFSGCCDSITFQTQVSTPSSFVVGESYYLETEIYSGCSYFISTGYTSGIAVVTILNSPSSGYSTCSACTTVYTCLPLPSPTPTPTNTKTPTNTPSQTITPTKTPTSTKTPTPNVTPSITPSKTKTPFPTRTATPSNTSTSVPLTPTSTPTNTNTPTNTQTNTVTPSNTQTNTVTPSNTPTNTNTKTPLPSFVPTSTPTLTPTTTLTLTPTTTQYTSCTTSSFCVFTNFSATTQYNGSYDYYGEYNGKSFYYCPYCQTNSFLFYKSGETRWCISTYLGGECILFGGSPSFSLCPDLSNTFFNTNCPAPTPSNTDICNTFNFTASFDCLMTGTTPTPSITNTPTITPTVTITPTSYCLNKSVTVSATTFFYNFITPTPSTTPINTSQNCILQGNVDFDLFKSTFESNFNKLLLDCSNGNSYIVKELIPFNTGATFNAIINGEGLCVTYISDIFAPSTDSLDLIQSGNLIDCINCIPLPSATPTATVTKTPTQTPTISLTPSTTPCQNKGIDYTFVVGSGLNSLNDNQKIIRLSDGNYIIVGSFTSYNSYSCSGIIKIQSNGVVDSTFKTLSGFSSITISEFSPVNVIEQSNGKLVCGGLFQFYSGVTTNGICKLNSDGTLDTSFSAGTGFSDGVLTFGLQSNEKIVVGGTFTNYNGNSVNYFCRLNADGTLDTEFQSVGGFDGIVTKISVLEDDSLIVVGAFNYYNTVYLAPKIIKLNADGIVDPTFNVGSGFDGTPMTLFIDSENSVYVSGSFSNYSVYGQNYGFIKLDLSGTPDSIFQSNIGTSSSVGYITSISESVDNNLIITMFSGSYFNGIQNGSILKINKEGFINTQFYTLPGFNNKIVDTFVDENNKVICLGSFNNFNGFNFNGIIRLLPCQSIYPTPTPTNTPTITPTQTATAVCGPTLIVNLSGTPETITFDTNNGYVYVKETYLGYAGLVEYFSASTRNIIGQLSAGENVSQPFFNEIQNYLFLPNTSTNNTDVYNTLTNLGVFSISSFLTQPVSVAIDTANQRAYILYSLESSIQVYSLVTNSTVINIGLSDGYMGSLVYDSLNDCIVCVGRNNSTITKINCTTFTTTVLGNFYSIPYTQIIYNQFDGLTYIPSNNLSGIMAWDMSTNSMQFVIDLSSFSSTIISLTYDYDNNFLHIGLSPNIVVHFDLNNFTLNSTTYTTISSISQIGYNSYDDKLYLLDAGNNNLHISCFVPSVEPAETQTPTPTPTATITPTNTITPFPSPTNTKTSTLTPTPSITSSNTPTPSITPTTTVAPYCPYSIDSVTSSGQLVSITNDTYNNYVWVIGKTSGDSYDSSYNLVSTFGAWATTPTSSVFDSVLKRVYVAVGSNVDSIDVTTSTLTPSLFSFSGTVYDLSIYGTLLAVADNTNLGVDIYDTGTGLFGTVYTSNAPIKLTWDNSGYIYVIDNATDLYIISWSTLSIVSTLNVGSGSNTNLIFLPFNNYLYILETGNNLWYIDTTSFTIVGSIDISSYSSTHGLTYNSDENYIYIGQAGSDLITIDVNTNTIIEFKENLRAPSSLYSILNYNPYDTTIWWGDDSSSTVDILCSLVSPIIPTPTPTSSVTSTPTVTPTNTQTPTTTKTPTTTPTVTNTSTPTNTPTNTNTPSPTTACPIVLGTTVITNSVNIDVYGNNSRMEVDTYNSYLWIGTTSNVEVYNSGGTYVTGYIISFPQTMSFDTTNNKMFVSTGSATTVIDSSTLLTASTITHSGVTSPNSSTFDSSTGKLGLLDLSINKVAIIDTNTESLDGYITLPLSSSLSIGYKGIIESDTNNGIMYIASNSIICTSGASAECQGIVYSVDPSTLTTGATVNFSGYSNSTPSITSMRFNPTNGYMYVLDSGKNIIYFDTTTNIIQGTITISGYSGNNNSMIYNINKDYLYVSNRQSPSTHGIIVIDCSTNTVVMFKNSILTSTGLAGIEYEPNSEILFYSTSNNRRITRLCT